MRASWSWSWLFVLAACEEHGSPADAARVGDCGVMLATVLGCAQSPTISASPQAADFGSIAVSTASPATTITITNSGGSESGGITPIITGTSAADFVVQNGCATLSPMGTCVMTVAFKPMSAGTKTASLVVSASPGGVATVNLTGTATN